MDEDLTKPSGWFPDINNDGFHWKDNWYFKKMVDGSVLIRHWNKTEDYLAGKICDLYLVIPQSEWCSIVAQMTEQGETQQNYRLVQVLNGVFPA